MQTIEIKFNEKVIASAILEEKEIQGKIRECLKITMARAKKAFVNNYFLREGERQTKLENVAKNLIAHENEKILRKENQKKENEKFRSELKIGDILTCSWGYEQTNVEFFKVVGFNKNKTRLSIQELSHEQSGIGESHGMACKVIPGEVYGPVIEKALLSTYIKIDSSVSLYLWDGKPQYKSWYA